MLRIFVHKNVSCSAPINSIIYIILYLVTVACGSVSFDTKLAFHIRGVYAVLKIKLLYNKCVENETLFGMQYIIHASLILV